jgi:hypothetical protein
MVLDQPHNPLPLLSLQEDDFQLSRNYYGVGTGNRSRGSVFGGIRKGKVAFQFGLFNNLDIDPFVLVDGPGPNDVVAFGDYRTQPGGGIDILFFPGDEQRSLFFGVGLYTQTYTFVGRSISTGSLFDLGQRSVFEGAFSMGFMGELERGTSIGIGWHTHLGWNFTFSSRR